MKHFSNIKDKAQNKLLTKKYIKRKYLPLSNTMLREMYHPSVLLLLACICVPCARATTVLLGLTVSVRDQSWIRVVPKLKG